MIIIRKIGFITDIQYIDESIPLIDKLTITIYDEESDQIVTINPTNYNKACPYYLFQEVEYTKKDNSIKPYIPKSNKASDLTSKELKFYQKSFLGVVNNPELYERFNAFLLEGYDILSPPKQNK